MNKTIIAIIIVAVIAVGGYFLLRGPQPSAPSSSLAPQQSATQSSLQEAPQTSPTPTTEVPVTQGTQPVNQNVVTYTDTGYSPNVLRVKVGETVTFKNSSSQSMWTASAVHPTHRGYPTTGGCIGSTFDACQGIQPGGSWPFKFDIAGTWKYHNHLSPGDVGTIIVE